MKTFEKTFPLLVFCCLIHLGAYSQVKIEQITHYLLPEFTKGVVLMTSGEKHEALLNYNSLTEEMIFNNNGKNLAMTDLDKVDTVYVAGKKFFLLHDKWVELLIDSKYGLYAENKCNLKDPGKPAAYGGTSQVSASTSYSSYFSGGQVYELQLPQGFETLPYTNYWFKKDGKLSAFFNLRQLTKLVGEKEDLAKKYIKDHGVKYEHQEQIVELIRYLEQN
jgi:hypothetical protein